MTDALRSGHGIAHSRVLVVRTPDSPLLCTGKVGRGVRKKGIRTSKVPFSPCGDWGGCLQGRVVGEAPVCHLPFQASGRLSSPFSPCGRRGQGDEEQQRVRTHQGEQHEHHPRTYSSSSSSRSARRRSSASKPGPSSPMSFRCWMISWALFSSSTCSSMNH